MHEQDGTTVPGAAAQLAAVDGVRQTRSTSKHKQRNHEATTQGTEYRYSLQATKKKSGHIEETQRRHEEAEIVARRSGCEFLVIDEDKVSSSEAKSRNVNSFNYSTTHRFSTSPTSLQRFKPERRKETSFIILFLVLF